MTGFNILPEQHKTRVYVQITRNQPRIVLEADTDYYTPQALLDECT